MSKLFLNDLFWTFQGEGYNSGRRALFVRMPHCNLRCSWCDTSFDTYTATEVEAFKAFAQLELGRFAVVTGGEPMMHRHSPVVVDLLHELGFQVAVESNGTQMVNADYDWITCSPKRDAQYDVHPYTYDKVSEFKYVVDRDFDFSILDRHATDAIGKYRYYLSPEFTEMAENVNKISDYIKTAPQWRLSVQSHKWLGIP
jgi:organic radical activating enzyme